MNARHVKRTRIQVVVQTVFWTGVVVILVVGFGLLLGWVGPS